MSTILYYYIYFGFWLFVAGACIGSFINVVVYRLPKGIFFSEARSYCPECGAKLKWYDLIPIFSFIFLKARCRCCKTSISFRYPLVEGVCAVMAVLCFVRYGFDLKLILSFGVLTILLAISIIDFETMLIPNSLTIALIPFAIGAVWVWNLNPLEHIIGFFVISVPMLLISIAIKGAFGEGDIKLMAVCGFLLGWENTLLAFFIALLTGSAYGLYKMISGAIKRKEHIAFGPHLCIGIAIAMLAGNEIINWYLHLFYLA